jgi:hypothetical protein
MNEAGKNRNEIFLKRICEIIYSKFPKWLQFVQSALVARFERLHFLKIKQCFLSSKKT